jgi:hypothetical protein
MLVEHEHVPGEELHDHDLLMDAHDPAQRFRIEDSDPVTGASIGNDAPSCFILLKDCSFPFLRTR